MRTEFETRNLISYLIQHMHMLTAALKAFLPYCSRDTKIEIGKQKQ